MSNPDSVRPPTLSALQRGLFWGAFLVPLALIAVAVGAVLLTPSTSALRSDLDDMASAAVSIAVFGLVVGLLTMAVVQTIKLLFPVRGWVQRYLYDQALSPIPWQKDKDKPLKMVKSNIPSRILERTEFLGRPSPTQFDSFAWFDAPVERLVAQLGTITQQQFEQFIGSLRVPRADDGPAQVPVLASILRFESSGELAMWAHSQPGGDGWLRNIEVSVGSQLEYELDRIQALLGNSWRQLVRLSACITAGAVAASVLAIGGSGFELAFFTSIGIAVLGGFFSWLARDLVASLERLRR